MPGRLSLFPFPSRALSSFPLPWKCLARCGIVIWSWAKKKSLLDCAGFARLCESIPWTAIENRILTQTWEKKKTNALTAWTRLTNWVWLDGRSKWRLIKHRWDQILKNTRSSIICRKANCHLCQESFELPENVNCFIMLAKEKVLLGVIHGFIKGLLEGSENEFVQKGKKLFVSRLQFFFGRLHVFTDRL